jgi:hypothetical protein
MLLKMGFIFMWNLLLKSMVYSQGNQLTQFDRVLGEEFRVLEIQSVITKILLYGSKQSLVNQHGHPLGGRVVQGGTLNAVQ